MAVYTKQIEVVQKEIIKRVNSSKSILVVSCTPVDGDSLGTGLALKFILQDLGKSVRLVSWGDFRKQFDSHPYIKEIEFIKDMANIDFDQYDIIITVDGGGWYMAFGENYQEVRKLFSSSKLIQIDHHPEGDIAPEIPETSLVINAKSCAEVLYTHLVEPMGIILSDKAAEQIYFGVIQDTVRFKRAGAISYYTCYKLLKNYSIDHDKLVESRVAKEVVEFTSWAINHTQYYDDLRLMVLEIDTDSTKELSMLFGEDFKERDLDNDYKENVFRKVEGYDYGITLEQYPNNITKIRWRTRDFGKTINIKEVVGMAGFDDYGGHRNAGGGNFKGSAAEAKQSFLSAMEVYLKKQ